MIHVNVTHGDGIAGMYSLAPGSVSLVLSDLPSGETAAEFDTPVNLDLFWPAMWHALKLDGQAVLMASSIRFAAALIASQAKAFRYDLIWEKSLAVGFLNARHRPLRAHEFILVFSKARATYNPQMLQGRPPISKNSRDLRERSTVEVSENYGKARSRHGVARDGATDRYPRSVVQFGSVPTASRRVHPQQKPVPLLQMLVRQYSNVGDLVVDPCAGSGSTGLAAILEGRAFVGWDVSPRFAQQDLAG